MPELEPQELGHPIARTARIDVGEAPVIDGDLSDVSWAKATVIDDIRQRQPDPGAPATERTVVRVMYDANAIYFSVYAYDKEPEQVIVRSRARDGQILTSDNIQIVLDPGLTRTNAYVFMMAPSGGRWDGLRLNNLEELPQWDTLWEGRAMRVPDGWVAEIAIPFRSISYVPGQSDWGFDFTRYIRRKGEIVRWSSTNPAIELTDISEAGTLTGISDVTQGLGLDIQPYVALRAQHDWSKEGDGAGISATGGGNIFYKVTPGLTGTLTFNPDFSDAPLDVREVNTTRFSLFLPETRDFFLQDAGNFEFGGRPFRRTANDRQSNNARPFFSRNLGLVQGKPVSLIAGGKLSGEYGGFNIGALSVLTDETSLSPGQVLSVARVTHQVFSQSNVGFVFTNGDPTGLSRNTVAGADFQYRDTMTIPGKTVMADFFYEQQLVQHARRRQRLWRRVQLSQRAVVRRFHLQGGRPKFHAGTRLREPARCDPLRRHVRISRAVSRSRQFVAHGRIPSARPVLSQTSTISCRTTRCASVRGYSPPRMTISNPISFRATSD